MKISKETRQRIFEEVELLLMNWESPKICGRMSELQFLSRLFNLAELPASDPAHENFLAELFQRSFSGPAWDDYWIFYDKRFNLMGCDDRAFLRFLCEMLHPDVRSSLDEVEELYLAIGELLAGDGFELVARPTVFVKNVYWSRPVE